MKLFGKWHLLFKVKQVPMHAIKSDYFSHHPEMLMNQRDAEMTSTVFVEAYRLALHHGGIKKEHWPKGKRS